MTMEEDTPTEIFSSAAEVFVLKSMGWKPQIVVEREPRCGCDDGYSGGYMWDFGSRRYMGGCMNQHPCPAGQRGAHPADWIVKPWNLRHGLHSPRATPRYNGSCHPAPC